MTITTAALYANILTYAAASGVDWSKFGMFVTTSDAKARIYPAGREPGAFTLPVTGFTQDDPDHPSYAVARLVDLGGFAFAAGRTFAETSAILHEMWTGKASRVYFTVISSDTGGTSGSLPLPAGRRSA